MHHRVTVARNLLKAWLLFLIPAGLLGFIGWRLGDYRLALLFAGSVFLLAAVVYWYSDRIAMGMVGARELLPAEAPALAAAVSALSGRARVIRPKLYVIPDGYPRALCAGRGARGGASLAVSTGLLGVATPAELEGIVAHEIAHIRARDVLTQSVVTIVAAAIIESSRIGGYFQRGFLFVLGPIAASFVHLMLSPKREYDADREAAALCESPHGLADGLIRLEAVDGARGVPGEPGDGAALHGRPVRERGSGGTVPDASSARGARSAAARPRRGLARAAARSMTKGPLRGPVSDECNGRRPTLPGDCSPSTIGASGLNFSVRNGKRCFPAAMTAQLVRRAAMRRVLRRFRAHPQNSIAVGCEFKIKTSSN